MAVGCSSAFCIVAFAASAWPLAAWAWDSVLSVLKFSGPVKPGSRRVLGPLQGFGEVDLLPEAELRRLLPGLPVEAGRVAQLVPDLPQVDLGHVGHLGMRIGTSSSSQRRTAVASSGFRSTKSYVSQCV